MAHSVLHDILVLGVESRASDWHIKEGAPITLRISGSLNETDFIPDHEFMERIVSQMTTPENFAEFQKKGDLDVSFVEDDAGRFRVNIHRQRGTLAITMRHVKTDIMTVEQLGLPPIISTIAESQRGIILVTGTTGSGKSTTLASMLEHVNRNFTKHVITIEDPIEYEFYDKKSFFEQREVGLDTMSFYSALVGSLRQDPDIIMVGEMRDRASFEAALQAADTGHLVMSTVHATNSSQTVNRILDFFPHDEQKSIREALSINLRAVISQRLLPRAFGGGVVPAIEIMLNTPIIRKLIEQDKLDKLSTAVETSGDDGMQSFNKALLKLVNEGLVTEEVALEAASNPEALKMNFKGIFLDSDRSILGM